LLKELTQLKNEVGKKIQGVTDKEGRI